MLAGRQFHNALLAYQLVRKSRNLQIRTDNSSEATRANVGLLEPYQHFSAQEASAGTLAALRRTSSARFAKALARVLRDKYHRWS
jgi:hypothetical protein